MAARRGRRPPAPSARPAGGGAPAMAARKRGVKLEGGWSPGGGRRAACGAAALCALLALSHAPRAVRAAWDLEEHWDDDREGLDAAFFRKENREDEVFLESPGYVHTYAWRTSASNGLPERYGYYTYDPDSPNPEKRTRVYRPRKLMSGTEYEVWDDECGVAVDGDRVRDQGHYSGGHEPQPLPFSKLPDLDPDTQGYRDNMWVSCRRAAYPGDRLPREDSGPYVGDRPLDPELYGPHERGVFAPINPDAANKAGEVDADLVLAMAAGFGARHIMERELAARAGRAGMPLREVYGLKGAGVPEDWLYSHDPVGYGHSQPHNVPPYARRYYTVEPLRWGFEEGTFEPFWFLKVRVRPRALAG